MMTILVWFLLLMTMTTMIDPVQYGERERPAPWRASRLIDAQVAHAPRTALHHEV